MALTTTCPACNTRFKVVPDQLRLHHGLVRCGACDHVFDANPRLESLTEPTAQVAATVQGGYYDTDANATGWIHKPAVQALSDPQAFNATQPSPWTQLLPNPSLEQVNLAPGNQTAPAAQSPSEGAVMGGSTQPSDAAAHSAGPATVNPADHQERQERQERRARRQAKQRKAAAQSQPETQTQAQTQAQADTTAVLESTAATTLPRPTGQGATVAAFALMALCAAALVLAAWQLALAARYGLADTVPALKPMLVQLCKPFGCAVEPAQWLAPVTLDALSLTKTSSSSAGNDDLQSYRMQATVRNSSQLTIQTPDIELTVSNAQGNVIARKVLSAQQIGAAKALIPNSDWQIDSLVLLDSQTVGYTARLVY